MKRYIRIILGVGVFISILLIIFWVSFNIVLVRRPKYIITHDGQCGTNEYKLYCKNNGIKYYTDCSGKIDVIEDRTLHQKKVGSLKKIIKNGNLKKIIKQMSNKKIYYSDGLESDYSGGEKFNITISRCENNNEIYYLITDSYEYAECNNNVE